VLAAIAAGVFLVVFRLASANCVRVVVMVASPEMSAWVTSFCVWRVGCRGFWLWLGLSVGFVGS
jgi:hypothetical protein